MVSLLFIYYYIIINFYILKRIIRDDRGKNCIELPQIVYSPEDYPNVFGSKDVVFNNVNRKGKKKDKG